MHPAANPYQEHSVTTATPAQLVLMLFDRALLATARARRASTEGGSGAVETVNRELQRAQDILTELRVALDHDRGGDVAGNLAALYDYCTDELLQANFRKDLSRLDPVDHAIRGLRDAWEQACVQPAAVAV